MDGGYVLFSESRCLIDVGQDTSVEATDEGKPSRSPIPCAEGVRCLCAVRQQSICGLYTFPYPL
ncbi:hypothetical protein FOMPIDRAFT_1023715 [Fomitopsis schrenkii]|uniref:Uncharacterized protein n=1 Tax=Fomitopsis schrenkii TaxID=2126942 RepID=S8E6A2_FOMSC|nr:hypothetical protein FOMPIDRAFT_1023715 [Fomitopsis schrenkii]